MSVLPLREREVFGTSLLLYLGFGMLEAACTVPLAGLLGHSSSSGRKASRGSSSHARVISSTAEGSCTVAPSEGGGRPCARCWRCRASLHHYSIQGCINISYFLLHT